MQERSRLHQTQELDKTILCNLAGKLYHATLADVTQCSKNEATVRLCEMMHEI